MCFRSFMLYYIYITVFCSVVLQLVYQLDYQSHSCFFHPSHWTWHHPPLLVDPVLCVMTSLSSISLPLCCWQSWSLQPPPGPSFDILIIKQGKRIKKSISLPLDWTWIWQSPWQPIPILTYSSRIHSCWFWFDSALFYVFPIFWHSSWLVWQSEAVIHIAWTGWNMKHLHQMFWVGSRMPPTACSWWPTLLSHCLILLKTQGCRRTWQWHDHWDLWLVSIGCPNNGHKLKHITPPTEVHLLGKIHSNNKNCI